MRYLVIILCLLFSLSGMAQKRVKLKHADITRGSIKDGKRIDWLIGNVVLVQNQTTIYCDSAQIFREVNSVEAYGRIKITEGDSVIVTASSLTYDGNARVAHLRGNVVFTKLATATLYTDYLDFYRQRNEARYFNGGKLVDSTNTLTSYKGYYNTQTNLAAFKKQVVGVNKDYTLESDTLQYNAKSKIVYFKDLTTIKDADGQTATYTSGFYNTTEKQSDLHKGQVETPTYFMRGDRYTLDDARKLYKAKFNVVMTSKDENMTIYGQDGYYDKKLGISKVWGNAYIAKAGDDGDTLFLSADTLVSIENKDPRKKRLLAYNNVKIFKFDLQGIADSLVYVQADSMLYFYKKPALWNTGNQMTSDSIRVLLKNRNIDRIFLLSNAFVIGQDSLTNFNQIKGRKMTAYFQNKQIHHVNVEGNGESLYYALQEKEEDLDSVRLRLLFVTGLNKMICSNMRINFVDGRVSTVSAYVKPDAQFIPPHEIKREDTRLKGFNWRWKERPTRNQVEKKKKSPQNATGP